MSLDAFFCFLFFYSTRYIRVMLVYRSESYVNAAICLERVVLGGDFVDEVASDKWNLGEDVPGVSLQSVIVWLMQIFRGARLTSSLVEPRRKRRWRRRQQLRQKWQRGYPYNSSKHCPVSTHCGSESIAYA
jgi:hypothetical protein